MGGLFRGAEEAAAAVPARALGAWLWGAALGVWGGGLCLLGWVDWRQLAVPTRLVRGVAAASGLLLVAASALRHDWHSVEAGTTCAAGVGSVLATWSLLRPGQLGFGDVRVGALVAFGAGAVSPAACLAAVPAACLVAGLGGKLGQVLGTGAAATRPITGAQASASPTGHAPARRTPAAPAPGGGSMAAAPTRVPARSRVSPGPGGLAVPLVPFLALGGIIVVIASAA
jgi:hypothetical protein